MVRYPAHVQTTLQSVDKHIQYLEQIHKEVTATLQLTAREMRSGGPQTLSHVFHQGDQVLLESTNLQTTHPKAKLAPQRYGPFKVIWASPTNCKLELPSHMRIHPVFHNSLLKPYKETLAHRPNFKHPSPEIVGREEGHYEIEFILASRPTRNRKSTQYLVKWKGYPASENSWIPAKELTHAKELLERFKKRPAAIQKLIAEQKQNKPCEAQSTIRRLLTQYGPHELPPLLLELQAQLGPKEGILSWAKPTPSQIPRESPTRTLSPSRPTLKSGYSQVVKPRSVTRDPEKVSHISSRVPSRDLPEQSRGQARDFTHSRSRAPPRDQSQDQSRGIARAVLRNESQDQTRFRHAPNLLIGTWKTVGTNQRGDPQGGSPGVSAVALKG